MIRLRMACPTDAGGLGAILTQGTEEHAWKPVLHNAAQDIAHVGVMIDRGWVTLAAIADQVCGFIALESSYVHALFVERTQRGAGVGSALLRYAQAVSERLDLWTFQANQAARHFYARHGFSEIRSTNGRENDEGVPDVQLRWRAGGAQHGVTRGAPFGCTKTTPVHRPVRKRPT